MITAGDPAFVAGSLREQPLEQIWRTSSSLRLLRAARARDRAECLACPVADACGGECWVQAHYAARARGEAAGYAAPFPYCDLVRPLLEELAAEVGGGRRPPAPAASPPGLRRPVRGRRRRLRPLRLHLRLLTARACPARPAPIGGVAATDSEPVGELGARSARRREPAAAGEPRQLLAAGRGGRGSAATGDAGQPHVPRCPDPTGRRPRGDVVLPPESDGTSAGSPAATQPASETRSAKSSGSTSVLTSTGAAAGSRSSGPYGRPANRARTLARATGTTRSGRPRRMTARRIPPPSTGGRSPRSAGSSSRGRRRVRTPRPGRREESDDVLASPQVAA